MSREVHVRFCERRRVRLPPPTLLVLGFQHQSDAERFRKDLADRLARFGLSLNADKTRLIRFGRFAAQQRSERGLGRPETFEFLGFTHYCATPDDQEAHGGQATRDQGLADATPPLAHRGTGTLARGGGARPPRLLLGPGQHPPSDGLPRPARAALAPGAAAPRPATPHELAEDAPPRGSMAPSRPLYPSLAQ